MTEHFEGPLTRTNVDNSRDSAPSNPRRGLPRGVWPLVMGAVVLTAVVAFVGVVLGHSNAAPSATVTVTGLGTVQGTPDTVSFQIGVHTVAPNATTAFAQNNARIYSLETALLRQGVTKKEMQTTGLNIYANTNSSNQITGFSVDNNLSITMHHTQRAGGAIDAAVGAVGNGIQMNGITFSISNNSSLLASARASAMHNALAAATQIARGANTSVGRVVRVVDQENLSPPNVMYGFSAASSRPTNLPLQAGSQPVSVQVTVVYALN